MKTNIALFLAIIAPIFSHAERLILRNPAIVMIQDESGKTIGQRRLKGGTQIEIVGDATPTTSAKPGVKPGAPGKGRLKLSDISPAAYLADQETTPATFRAVIQIEPNVFFPREIRDNKKAYFGILAKLYNKASETYETAIGIVSKNTPGGKKLYSLIADGEEHPCHATVRFGVIKGAKDKITVEDVEPVEKFTRY